MMKLWTRQHRFMPRHSASYFAMSLGMLDLVRRAMVPNPYDSPYEAYDPSACSA